MKKILRKLNIFCFFVFLCNLGYAQSQYVEENKFRIAPIILSAQEQFEEIKAGYAASDTADLKRVVDNLRPQPGSLITNGMPIFWLYDIHVYQTGMLPDFYSGISIGVHFYCPIPDSGARVQESHPNIHYDANGNLSNIDHVCELTYSKEINPRDYICEANNPNLFTPNPVFLPTGEKMLLEVDYIDRNPSPLNIIRSYRSRPLYGKSTTFNFGPKLLSIGNSAEIANNLDWIQWNSSFRPETSQYDNFTKSRSALVEHNGDYFVFSNSPASPGVYKTTGPNLVTFNITQEGAETVYRLDDEIADSAEYYSLYKTDGEGQQTISRYRISKKRIGNDWYTYQYPSATAEMPEYIFNQFGRFLKFIGSGSTLTSIVTDDGKVYTYYYDAQSNVTGVSYPDGMSKTYSYLGAGHLLTGIDINGAPYGRYAYNSHGQVGRTELGFNSMVWNIDWSNNYPSVTDPLGTNRVVNFGFSGGKLYTSGVTPYVQPYGSPTMVQSGSHSGLLDSESTFTWARKTLNWNEQRRLPTKITDAEGSSASQTTDVEWHPSFRLPTKITESGVQGGARVTQFAYDSHKNLIAETVSGSGLPAHTRSWTFDSNNLLSTASDQTGATTAYGHDQWGRHITTTDPLGRVTTVTRDSSGNVLSLTTPNGLAVAYTYDPMGRLLTQLSSGLLTSMTYHPTGLLASVTLPSGYKINYIYDAAHRLTSWRDNRNNTGSYHLDGFGNALLEQTKSADGAVAFELSRTINDVNRISQQTVAGNQSVSFQYDANGDLIGATNGLGDSTSFVRDELRRLISHVDPNNTQSFLSYNALDAITQAKDFKGVTTSYTRDALGNAKQEVTPDAGTGSATYDVRGLLASTTDATGRTIGVERDALGRITKINYNNGTSSVLRYDLTGTTYNTAAAPNASIGHLSEVQDPGVTTQYQRDALGRVLRKTQILAGGATKSIAYTYVPAGQGGAGSVQSITYPSGKQLTYQYSSTGLITGMQWNGAALLSGLTWNPLGMPKGWSWPGILAAPGATAKLAEARSYNTAGQLTHTGILDLTWDAAGRVSAIEQSQMVPAAASAGGAATTTVQARIASAYTYDAAGRMTASGHSLKSTPAVNWPKVGTLAAGLLDVAGYNSMGYAYDANGNRLSASIVKTTASGTGSGSTTTTTRTYSLTASTNVLASIASTTSPGNAVSTKTYQYDAAGAITAATTSGTTSGAQYLHYGANGRVAKVTGTASSIDPSAVSYLYNSASQRLLKTDARQSTTAPRTEHTLYSEEDSAQLLGTYSNQRSASSAAPAGEMDSTEVIYLPTAQGMVPVAAQINGRLYAIHADHLSTPRRLTNQQGQVAWQWLLTGFGEVSPTTGAKGYVQADSSVANSLPSYAPEVTFNLRYPGQQWDEETQLSYNVNRYYGPQEGRYIQADPIGLDGGWNRFAYVGGNPLSYTDPQGLCIGPLAYACGWALVYAYEITIAGVIAADLTLAISTGAVNPVIAGPASFATRAKTIAQEIGAIETFANFSAAKKVYGVAGKEIHHVVEQCQVARSGFPVTQINSTNNLINLDPIVHGAISAEYSSYIPGTTIRLRDYLNGKSFDDQYKIGMEIIQKHMEK